MEPQAKGINASGAANAMDRMYRWQHAIYDLTRKPYLLGRDQMIEALRPKNGERVLEIGCGTGRNLIVALNAGPTRISMATTYQRS